MTVHAELLAAEERVPATAISVNNAAPPLVPAMTTRADLMRLAIEKGAFDVVERMVLLDERAEEKDNKRRFNEAVSSAKGEIPVITKNRTGHNNKKYADFAQVARTVDPVLARHGLGYRFCTTQIDKLISVTCILFHSAGHDVKSDLSAPPDISGNKNAIQAIGSTLTYLQRYTLFQALGLAASEDDDGQAGGGGNVTEDQAAELVKLIKDVKADEDRFTAHFGIKTVGDLPADRLNEARGLLKAKKRETANA